MVHPALHPHTFPSKMCESCVTGIACHHPRRERHLMLARVNPPGAAHFGTRTPGRRILRKASCQLANKQPNIVESSPARFAKVETWLPFGGTVLFGYCGRQRDICSRRECWTALYTSCRTRFALTVDSLPLSAHQSLSSFKKVARSVVDCPVLVDSRPPSV